MPRADPMDHCKSTSCVLLVPTSWGEPPPCIGFELTSISSPSGQAQYNNRHYFQRQSQTDDGFYVLMWTGSNVPLGDYCLLVSHPPFRAHFLLATDDCGPFKFTVGMPVNVTCRVISTNTHDPVMVDLLAWAPVACNCPPIGRVHVAPYDSVARHYRIRAATGEISLSVIGAGIIPQVNQIRVSSESLVHTVLVDRSTGVRVRWYEGSAVRAMPVQPCLRMIGPDGQDVLLAESLNSSEHVYLVRRAGLTTLIFATIDGCMQIPDRIVDIPNGQLLEVEVQVKLAVD